MGLVKALFQCTYHPCQVRIRFCTVTQRTWPASFSNELRRYTSRSFLVPVALVRCHQRFLSQMLRSPTELWCPALNCSLRRLGNRQTLVPIRPKHCEGPTISSCSLSVFPFSFLLSSHSLLFLAIKPKIQLGVGALCMLQVGYGAKPQLTLLLVHVNLLRSKDCKHWVQFPGVQTRVSRSGL